MTEFINHISDLISTYWPQILAILSSTTFVLIFCKFIFSFILIKVRAKENRKTNSAVEKKYEALETKLDATVERIETVLLGLIEKQSNMTKQQFNDLFEQYQKTKQTFMNAVINTNKEAEKVLEEARQIKEENDRKAKEEQNTTENTENIENNAEIKPEEQIVEEEVKKEENNENNTNNEEEYIVVEKVYGE